MGKIQYGFDYDLMRTYSSCATSLFVRFAPKTMAVLIIGRGGPKNYSCSRAYALADFLPRELFAGMITDAQTCFLSPGERGVCHHCAPGERFSWGKVNRRQATQASACRIIRPICLLLVLPGGRICCITPEPLRFIQSAMTKRSCLMRWKR